MLTFRAAALRQSYAERCERHVALRAMQGIVSQALQAQVLGDGRGPTEAQVERLAVLLAAAEHADGAYLHLLGMVGDEIIASAKASARSRS